MDWLSTLIIGVAIGAFSAVFTQEYRRWRERKAQAKEPALEYRVEDCYHNEVHVALKTLIDNKGEGGTSITNMRLSKINGKTVDMEPVAIAFSTSGERAFSTAGRRSIVDIKPASSIEMEADYQVWDEIEETRVMSKLIMEFVLYHTKGYLTIRTESRYGTESTDR